MSPPTCVPMNLKRKPWQRVNAGAPQNNAVVCIATMTDTSQRPRALATMNCVHGNGLVVHAQLDVCFCSNGHDVDETHVRSYYYPQYTLKSIFIHFEAETLTFF